MDLYKVRLILALNPGPDRVYTVTSPDIPGLITEGSTPEEIQANVKEALEGLILAHKEVGQALPFTLRPFKQAKRADTLITLGNDMVPA